MKKSISKTSKILFCAAFLLLVCNFNSYAQSELAFHRGTMTQDGRVLRTSNETREVLSVNSEALRLYNSGRPLELTGFVLACAGAGLLGAALLPGSGDSTTLLAVGAGAIGLGVGITAIGRGRIRQAVSLYNSGIQNMTSFSYQIDFGLTQIGGIGFTMRF